MNNEIMKAINKTNKAHPMRDWWYNNSYKVWRVVLFPIWFAIIGRKKIVEWLDSRVTWSEERADEILQYYVPRYSEWSEEEKSFFFFDNSRGWSIAQAKRYLKFKDRRFWKVNACWWGGDIRKYLINKFELQGFEKIINDTYDGRTEIVFKMIEK